MSNCESKKITQLIGANIPLSGEELVPIVQNGENKTIQVKDLCGAVKPPCPPHSGDCCKDKLSEAICNANLALEYANAAMEIANKAYILACANDKDLKALKLIVKEHSQLICEIQAEITRIYHRIDEVENKSKVTLDSDTNNPLETLYILRQNSIRVGTIAVPTIEGIIARLRILTFRAGRFGDDSTVKEYNGGEDITVRIPTKTSHLENDGDGTNNYITKIIGYNGDGPVTANSAGVATLENLGLPKATESKLGAIKLGSNTVINKGATIQLNASDQGIIPVAENNKYGVIKLGYSGNSAPVKVDSDGNAYVDPSDLNVPENLDDLGDVEISQLHDGDVLYYDGTQGKWVNTNLATLVNQLIDCDTIKTCIQNFPFLVDPLEITVEHDDTSAKTVSVTADGSWIITLKSGSDNFTTVSIAQGTGNGTFTIKANSNNTGNSPRVDTYVVEEYLMGVPSGRKEEVKFTQKIDDTPPTPSTYTITYQVTGDSSKLDGIPSSSPIVTAGDSYNNTISIKSGEINYIIQSVTFQGTTSGWSKTPSSGQATSYQVSNSNIQGNVTIKIQVIQLSNPSYNVSYVVDPVSSASTVQINGSAIDPNGYSVTQGQQYTATITSTETINNVTSDASSGFSYNNGVVTLDNTITDDVEITVHLDIPAQHSLSVSPTEVRVGTTGTSSPEIVTVTNVCSDPNISLDTSQLPQGVTATWNSTDSEIEIGVANGTAPGTYTLGVSNQCGDTATVDIVVTVAYFDENTNNFAYFSPRGLPVDANNYTYDYVEHLNHSRDGFIDGHVCANGIVTYIDGNDQSWNMTIPYSSPNGINDLQVYYLREYITDGYGTSSPVVHTTNLDGAQATAANVSLIDNQNGTITVKMQLTSTVPTDLITSGYGPVNIQDFGSGDRSMASYSRNVGFVIKVLSTNPEYNMYPMVGSGSSAYHYILSTAISQDNYFYDDINNQSVNVSTGGSTDTSFRVPYMLPITAFGFTTQSGTSSWIKDIVYPQAISGTGYYYGKFNSDAGPAEVGELQYQFSWTGGSAGSINKVIEVNRQ